MKDENVYIKGDNGRYIPFGICCTPEHMPDGIWYVRHRDGTRKMTSIKHIQGMFRVGDATQADLTELCGMEALCDHITESKEFRDVIFREGGYTVDDIVHVCVLKLVELAKTRPEDHDRNNNTDE